MIFSPTKMSSMGFRKNDQTRNNVNRTLRNKWYILLGQQYCFLWFEIEYGCYYLFTCTSFLVFHVLSLKQTAILFRKIWRKIVIFYCDSKLLIKLSYCNVCFCIHSVWISISTYISCRRDNHIYSWHTCKISCGFQFMQKHAPSSFQ